MTPQARFEMKFLIQGAEKKTILEHLTQAMSLDPHGDEGVYRVTSLYFDSPALKAYWEKLDGVPIRKKIRLRYYGSEPEKPFIEIKHRRYEYVIKERLSLPADIGQMLLDGQKELQSLTLPTLTEDADATLLRIQNTAAADRSQGTIIISYLREAWVGIVNSRLRVTFDHMCQAHPSGCHRNVTKNSGLSLYPHGQVLMEVKFDHRLPVWLRDGLAQCKLRPVRFSKYAEGVTSLESIREEALQEARSKV